MQLGIDEDKLVTCLRLDDAIHLVPIIIQYNISIIISLTTHQVNCTALMAIVNSPNSVLFGIAPALANLVWWRWLVQRNGTKVASIYLMRLDCCIDDQFKQEELYLHIYLKTECTVCHIVE